MPNDPQRTPVSTACPSCGSEYGEDFTCRGCGAEYQPPAFHDNREAGQHGHPTWSVCLHHTPSGLSATVLLLAANNHEAGVDAGRFWINHLAGLGVASTVQDIVVQVLLYTPAASTSMPALDPGAHPTSERAAWADEQRRAPADHRHDLQRLVDSGIANRNAPGGPNRFERVSFSGNCVGYTAKDGTRRNGSMDLLIIWEAWRRDLIYINDLADGKRTNIGQAGALETLRTSSLEARFALLGRALNALFGDRDDVPGFFVRPPRDEEEET